MTIMSSERQASPLPLHLRPETVGTIALESPRVVAPNYIYYDRESDKTYLHSDELLTSYHRKIAQPMGLVAIMRVMINTGEDGYVADMTRVEDSYEFLEAAGDTMPTDAEESDAWLAAKSKEVKIAAIYSRDPITNESYAIGDGDFFAAAEYLAQLIDEAAVRDKPVQEVQEPTPPESYRFPLRDRIALQVIRARAALGLID